jgi:hypothetical protein
MASTRIPDAVRRVFTEAFTARDIAEPLASFDADASAAAVRTVMGARGHDVVGIRREGRIAGYVEKDRLGEGACGQYLQEFEEKAVLEDGAPLLNVLTRLQEIPFAFVGVLGSVGGIITRADLQKPPVRMWLFGVLTLIEMRCTSLIEEHCPAGSWKQYLSEARLQKAQALLDERRRRNQALELLDCLQFSDKGQVVARHEEIRKRTVFASRRQTDETIKRLEQLRNNLAHAQDIIVSDWQTIAQLCDFVLGHEAGTAGGVGPTAPTASTAPTAATAAAAAILRRDARPEA